MLQHDVITPKTLTSKTGKLLQQVEKAVDFLSTVGVTKVAIVGCVLSHTMPCTLHDNNQWHSSSDSAGAGTLRRSLPPLVCSRLLCRCTAACTMARM